MKSFFVSFLDRIDQQGSGLYLKLFGEKNPLIVLLFHSLFQNKEEMSKDLIAPQQGTTVDHFRQIIEHFQANNYSVASPDAIANGLDEKKRYVLLTFDDGYYNNVRAVPILQEYDANATFYISTNHVLSQKSYWWDSLHRNTSQLSMSKKDLVRFKNGLKSKRKTMSIRSIAD